MKVYCKFCKKEVKVNIKFGILNHYLKEHYNELTADDLCEIYLEPWREKKYREIDRNILREYFDIIIKNYNRERFDYQFFSHVNFVKKMREYTMKDLNRFFSHVLPWKKSHPKIGNCKELCDQIFEDKNEAKELYEKHILVKNPYYQHGSELSPFSTKHKRYADLKEEERRSAVADFIKSFAKELPLDCSPLHIEYYMKRGMTEAEAKEALKNRQSTFSLEKCIEKYGEEEGNKRWLERQEKWLKNFKKLNYSKVSQKLFWDIFEVFEKDADNIYFATLDDNKQRDDSGKNYEFLFRSGNRRLKLDFLLKNKKKVIEFDGYYWHRADAKRITNEEKDALLKEAGYDVYHVNEMDYYDDPTQVLKNCIKFLNT